MRACKYRGWHKKNCKMYEVGYLEFTPDGEIYGSLVNREIQLTWGGMLAGTEFELMQFTGLIDRTGKEIFEGDIVRYDAIDVQGAVTWVNTYPGFTILNPEKEGAYVIHEEWEVIGNIWEHLTSYERGKYQHERT